MGAIVPISNAQLTGELRKRLSWQYAQERFNRPKRMEAVARLAAEMKQNKRFSKNMKFLCEVPIREYFRIQHHVDRDFFRSTKDIKRFLLQDHPELKGGIGT